MRHLLPLLTLTLPLLLAACASVAPTAGTAGSRDSAPPPAASASGRLPARAEAPLILVSIDGMRNDYTERGLTPALQALTDSGTRAQFLRPSYPSITFPNHYTLVTGLRPDHHGVVANFMRDPAIDGVLFSMFDPSTTTDARWWNDGKPIWNSVTQAGGRSAVMFWVASEAPVHGHYPEYWHPFDIRVSPEQRVDTVLGWLDLPAEQRPHFIALYFDTVDTAGHRFGPDSDQVNAALVQVDSALARLVDGLRRRQLDAQTNLVIAADHGMMATSDAQVVYLDDYLDAALIQPIWTGAYAAFNALEGGQPQADALLGEHEHFSCMRREQIPARLAYGSHRRVPAYHCMAQPGWQLTTRAIATLKNHPLRGEHGYDNQLPQMHSPLILNGPAFKRGHTIAGIDNVDVYPLLAHLLGIVPASHDGDLQHTADALMPAQEAH